MRSSPVRSSTHSFLVSQCQFFCISWARKTGALLTKFRSSSQLRFRQKPQDDVSGGTQRFSQEGTLTPEHERNFEGITSEDEREYYLPVLSSFPSTPRCLPNPLPQASLFSICALTQSWLISSPSGTRIPDPGWSLALKIVSLVLALLANLILLFNFARRISYAIAQPLTIIFWYLSSIFLLVPVVITHTTLSHRKPSYVLSQAYWYAFIATVLYFMISTLLLFNLLGSCIFRAYKPAFIQLDRPQRTLMLQSIIFSAYLALGGAIFSAIEDWVFVDGLYWADYTLLTIGFGSELPLKTTAGRMILIPFAAVGLLIVGLIVNSVRGLVVERTRGRITKRRLQKERTKWAKVINKLRSGTEEERKEAERRFINPRNRWWKRKVREVTEDDREKKRWKIREFLLMRHIEDHSNKMERYIALASSFLFFVIVWVGGSVVFWACQLSDPAPWTYPESLYFTYATVLTIGFGDFYPTTASGRPFSVIWSLLAVPSVTIFIQNVGETIAGEVQNGVEWVGRWSFLPEKRSGVGEKPIENRNEDEERGGDICQRKFSIQIPPIENHRTTIKDKGKCRLSIEKEDAGRTLSNPQLLPQQSPQIPTTISGTTQQPLSFRLSRSITKISRDAAKDPTIRYTWHEWVRWLRLMDEAGEVLGVYGCYQDSDDNGKDADPASCRDHSSPRGISVPDDRQQHQRKQQYGDSIDGRTRSRTERTTTTLVDRWRWGWLDDNGPLFSSISEARWVLERLCRLFEDVVERELEGCQRLEGEAA
ncbi:hypothetical protein Agabi119p4_8361 [Agaricus bisporus var. burnettii]|uniref:Potassium channel domain-containing protein n=1 Tax=Agaricus bisporus var. burnettii TaxID=192524 RepID=A0A8H7C6X8_AGABI|nr:hypothetical protein Agabi119p4_8361 [Agaricus bisporus var. burnettii]